VTYFFFDILVGSYGIPSIILNMMSMVLGEEQANDNTVTVNENVDKETKKAFDISEAQGHF